MQNTPHPSQPGPTAARRGPTDTRAAKAARWREKVIEAQTNLMEFDTAVLEGRVPPDPKQRFGLDLLFRCARLRYDMVADPVENYVR